jgi:hypothetical protein
MNNRLEPAQRDKALRLANEKRRSLKNMKVKLEGGHLTLADVLLPTPVATIENTPVVEIVRMMPRYSVRCAARWKRLGDLANREQVNLFVEAANMPRWAREWVVQVVASSMSVDPTVSRTSFVEDDAGEVRRLAHKLAYTERRLRSAEKARDAVVRELEARDRLLQGQQFAMPTVEAERMLAELADAVEVHKRTVTGPTPPASWAAADETLWAEKDAILMSSAPPRLKAVA